MSIKVKLKKSDGQMNSDKYRAFIKKTLYHNLSIENIQFYQSIANINRYLL